MICKECGEDKKHHAKGMCRKCYSATSYKADPEKYKLRCDKWKKANPEKVRLISERANRKRGSLPMSKNRECAPFLGIHVAEQVLAKVFKDVTKMPHGYPGYDFICNHGKKIDVKSACMRFHVDQPVTWSYHIFKNAIPDFFLCIAFDNRNDLNPLHLWLIPGVILNTQWATQISETTISKWNKYRLPLDKLITCCDSMKQIVDQSELNAVNYILKKDTAKLVI